MSYQEIAKNSGFTVVGKMYTKKLAFKCEARNHLTKIRDCSKRYHQAIISCADCRKEEREAAKKQMQEEERKQQAIFAQRQEEMFRKAREEM